MAVVHLDRYDCEDGKVPPLCMCCGQETDTYVEKNFQWFPAWVYACVFFGVPGLILAVILSQVLSKRQKLECPICPDHGNHWSRNTWIVWLTFLLIPVGIAVLVVLGQEAHDDYTWMFVVGGALYSLFILIVMAVISKRVIRPDRITDEEMVLVNVHKSFAQEYRKLEEERHERRRARRRARRDDIDEDEDFEVNAPRRRRRKRRGDDDVWE